MYNLTILDFPFNSVEADDFCREKGILPKQMNCPSHRRFLMKLYKDRAHGRFRCTRNGCNKTVSGARKSFFEDTRLETHVALGIMFCFSWGLSYEQCEAIIRSLRRQSKSPEVNLSSTTTAHWFRYCREVVINHFNDMVASLPPLGGPGLIVQIDQSQFAHREFKRGRILQGSWVLGMIDQNKNVRMVVVEQRDTAILHREILKYVAPGSVIHTDSWPAFNGLENLPVTPQYVHKKVNNNNPEYPDDTGTRKIEARHFFRGRSRFCDDHYADRLCEYLWRRYCRKNGIDIFVAVLDAVKSQYPV